MTPTIVVFEDHLWQNLLPLTYLRPVFDLTCGRGSLLQKVERLAQSASSSILGRLRDGHELPAARPHLWCREELTSVLSETKPHAINRPMSGSTLFLNGRGWWKSCPPAEENGAAWVGIAGKDEEIACVFADADLAARLSPDCFLDEEGLKDFFADVPRRDVSGCVELFQWPWELIHANERALRADWSEAGANSQSHQAKIYPGSHILAPEGVHLGNGTRIKPCAVIDAEDGPVWIGDNVTISPHTYIQGPVSIGSGSLIQAGAVIHAGTTIGPVCKVGGEIEASILHGYSNKQHDGFLGHSYVGSWVNIAADCINSDLKNTYGTVRVPINGRPVETGEMFVGMLVGDYSKLGINVSFPTGAVVGFCSSVFASQSPKFVPSFVWVDGDTWLSFDEERGIEIVKKVMARRQREFSGEQENLFRRIRRLAHRLETYPEPIVSRQGPVEDWFSVPKTPANIHSVYDPAFASPQ
jgi:UDP-N-acetylglucosamine diphosphorylase / glucose-1-phosphate thymidylyltransferase / UDP-N-acetylgalactosamine diphosphorylase / glucosamine-1-phosphate N-acetyltransferase / galactosamine-1-phosphate N-acetyltransferase